MIGHLAGKDSADVVTVIGLALESEKRNIQPSKYKGLSATVVRRAQSAEEALAASRFEKATLDDMRTDGALRGDFANADDEAFFARRGAVALGESVLTVECNVKHGTSCVCGLDIFVALSRRCATRLGLKWMVAM